MSVSKSSWCQRQNVKCPASSVKCHKIYLLSFLRIEASSSLHESTKVTTNRTTTTDEYATLSGKEIGQLRKEGKVVSKEVEVPICAYLTDTHVDGLAPLFEASKPALAPFVIVECTYINGIHPESGSFVWGRSRTSSSLTKWPILLRE